MHSFLKSAVIATTFALAPSFLQADAQDDAAFITSMTVTKEIMQGAIIAQRPLIQDSVVYNFWVMPS